MFTINSQLFDSADHLLVAYSTGIDSTALLHFLVTHYKNRVSACYVNHQLRSESSEENCTAAQFCKTLGITYYSETIDVSLYSKTHKISIEEAARFLRYQALIQVAQQINATKIVTAHHQDDQVETILFRILRGTSLDGLRGIHQKLPMAIPIIRPFLALTQNELHNYVNMQELPFHEDASNQSRNYTRNRIRHDILPYIRNNGFAHVSTALLRLQNQAQEAHSWISSYVNIIFKQYLRKNGFLLSGFRAQAPIIQKEIIKQSLFQLNDSIIITEKFLTNVCHFLTNTEPQGQFKLSEKTEILKNYQRFFIQTIRLTKTKDHTTYPVFLTPSKTIIPHKGTLTIKIIEKLPEHYPCTNRTIIIDQSKLPIKNLVIRCREPGDQFWPLGAPGMHPLKRYFICQKTPKEQRDTVLLLCSEHTVLWIIGLQISDTIKREPTTQQWLQLSFTRHTKK